LYILSVHALNRTHDLASTMLYYSKEHNVSKFNLKIGLPDKATHIIHLVWKALKIVSWTYTMVTIWAHWRRGLAERECMWYERSV